MLVASGLHVPVAGTDQFHEYHAHPEFRYLAGVAVAGAALAYHPAEGWTLFAPVASQDERIWTGDGEPLDLIEGDSGVAARPSSALDSWLEGHRSEPLAILGNRDVVRRPEGYGIERWASLELDLDERTGERLSEQVAARRRAKDASELAAMRAAADASVAGHLLALRTARPGMSERALQVELEAEFFRNGGDRTAYGSIVGSGGNSAILHIAPSRRALADGDLVLIDAAAESHGYAADVTRTFPASSTFGGPQRDLYQLVLTVQERAIAGVRPGVEYRELHLAAAAQIAEGLVDLGILRGEPASLVEQDVHALFFPHGLGHMIGLSTHDAGGCLAGRSPSDRFGLKWLRADLPLQENYVVTIEPGIYFIPAILDDQPNGVNGSGTP